MCRFLIFREKALSGRLLSLLVKRAFAVASFLGLLFLSDGECHVPQRRSAAQADHFLQSQAHPEQVLWIKLRRRPQCIGRRDADRLHAERRHCAGAGQRRPDLSRRAGIYAKRLVGHELTKHVAYDAQRKAGVCCPVREAVALSWNGEHTV